MVHEWWLMTKLLCLLIWEALSSPTLFTSSFLVGGARGKHQINQEILFIGVDISLKRRTKRCRASSAKKHQKIIVTGMVHQKQGFLGFFRFFHQEFSNKNMELFTKEQK